MKAAKIALILAILLLSFGCIIPPQPSGAVPSDFEVSYGYGACHAEWGRTTVSIDAQGNGVYESGSGPLLESGRFAEEEFYKTFRLDENELLSLLNGIEASGFYSLDDYYSDPNIVDGSCRFILVTKNNSTKSVSVSNTEAPEAFSRVADLVGGVAESKTQ